MATDPTAEGLKSAADTVKQIITLASGIAALTITFAKEFAPKGATVLTVPWQLKLAWIGYGATVFFGVWSLLAITGSLAANPTAKRKTGAMESNVRLPSLGVVISFVAALGLTIAAGFSIVQ